MADFPSHPALGGVNLHAISTYGPNALMGMGANPSGTAWPAANDALFIPFRIAQMVTVYRLACGSGTGSTGNFDLGIYDASGNRLVSTGSTAKTSASSERVIDVTDTVLFPGMYYLAMAVDGTGSYIATAPANAGMCKLAGMRKMASAFALPATATFATTTAAYIPMVAAYLRSTA